MKPMTRDELIRALRCRFEADALLGADVLPIRLPRLQTARAPVAGGTVGRAGIGRRAETGAQVAAEAAAAPAVLESGGDGAGGAAAGSAAPGVSPLPPPPPITAEDAEQRRIDLQVMDDHEVKPCVKCGLAATRTKTVFGVGSATARIVFVGEAPGHDEDVTGEPFVGRAGKLLTDMIEKGMGLRRQDVYICNVLKCRPPNNRTPAADEIIACRDYLWRQLAVIRPQLIIALGAPAAQTLLGTREGISALRGRFHDFYPSGSALIGEPIPLLPTFHPAYLLRSPGEKTKAWADLKLAMALLGIPIPRRR